MERNTMANSGRSNLNRTNKGGICPLEGDQVIFTAKPQDGIVGKLVPPVRIEITRDYGHLGMWAWTTNHVVGKQYPTQIHAAGTDEEYEAIAQSMIDSGDYEVTYQAWGGQKKHSERG